MANNEILQIVVFSVFVVTAVAAVDDKAPAVLVLVEQIAQIMLKVTGYVMKTENTTMGRISLLAMALMMESGTR